MGLGGHGLVTGKGIGYIVVSRRSTYIVDEFESIVRCSTDGRKDTAEVDGFCISIVVDVTGDGLSGGVVCPRLVDDVSVFIYGSKCAGG